MNKNNRFIDFLKGITIILVLIGHCVQYGSGAPYLNEELFWDSAIMKTIYSFHMPLFIAISGYLFWYSVKKHGMLSSIKIRIVRLMPVCFTWTIILSAVDIAKDGFAGVEATLRQLLSYFLTVLWFLWSIIFCVCCVAIIEWSARKLKKGGLLSSAIMLSMFVISPDALWTHAYKYVAPYFIAGYYYAKGKHKWLESNKVGIIASVLWVILMPLYSKDAYIYIQQE